MSAAEDLVPPLYGLVASAYLEGGWDAPLPLPEAQKSPSPPGFTGDKAGAAVPTAVQIAAWTQTTTHVGKSLYTPASNIGLRAPVGTVGLDLDLYKPEGRRSYDELVALCGPLPDTWVSTARNDASRAGIYWYSIPVGVKLHGKPPGRGGIEIIQRHHRYAVAPPSVHPDLGVECRWLAPGWEPSGEIPNPSYDFPPLPDAWLTELRVDAPTLNGSAPARHHVNDWSPAVTKAYADAVAGLTKGSRHDTATAGAAALARYERLEHPGATEALEALGRNFRDAIGDRATEGQAEKEWSAILSSAQRLAATTPSTAPIWVERRGLEPKLTAGLVVHDGVDPDTGEILRGGPDAQLSRRPDRDRSTSTQDRIIASAGALADGFRPTDAGNSDRFIANVNGRARFVHAWGKWIVYVEGRWIIDTNDALVVEMAKGVARTMITRAAELEGKDRDALWAHARRCEQAHVIAAMLRMARGAPGVLVEHGLLDADPWLLNVANGTIDLRTGQLRNHDPDDLITMQAPVLYDENATSPLWDACVARWQPDPQVRDFLRRAVGTALTGHPVEALFVNVGNGGNGKSRFFGAITRVLGPYAVEPHKSLLVADRHEGHPTHLASLFRARLAVAPETRQGDRLDEALVKNLTGGDRLRARRMREDEWSFTPSHTAFIHTNHKPRVRGTDEGIWRRIRLIPWTETIPAGERDEHLADKLDAEASGILNWLIAGALDWQAHGLAEPDTVRHATDAYRQGEDHLGRFLADRCVTGDRASVPARTMREAYEAWCTDEGERPLTAQALGRDLAARGFDSAKVGKANVRTWMGLDLVEHHDEGLL